MSYDESRPADWTSYDRVATASADLRLMFEMHAIIPDLKRALGPENYQSVLEYLDCIDKNVEKMGKHAIAWAKETLDETMRGRVRRLEMRDPNATTNDLWNLLETRSDDGQEDNHYNHDDADQDVGGFREPSSEDLASAAALGSRADAIYEWLRVRYDQPRGEQLPDEIAHALRGQSLMIAFVENRRKESDR